MRPNMGDDEVQAFELEASGPSEVKPLVHKSRATELPPLAPSAAAVAPTPATKTQQPAPSPSAEVDTSEVDMLLNMNTHAGQPLLLGEERDGPLTPPLPEPQRHPNGGSATQVEGFSSQQPASGSGAEATANEHEPPADEEDPWASLQSTYKIGGGGAGAKARQSQARGAGGEDDEDEVVVLDEGRRDSETAGGGKAAGMGGGGRARGGVQQQQAPRVSQGAGKPRAGDWGNGDLAAAGTLMLGESPQKPPPRAGGAAAAAQPLHDDLGEFEDDDGLALGVGGGRAAGAASHGAGDMGMEDVEDVDALIEAEMAASGLNNDLAAKLRRFEAMNEDG